MKITWLATLTFVGILAYTNQAALASTYRIKGKPMRPAAARNERVGNAQASAMRRVGSPPYFDEALSPPAGH